MRKPLIGISPDRNDEANNIESHFFLRRNYCSAVAAGGAIPLILPYQMELVEHYLDTLDAIVLSGGMFDIDPIRYGARPAHNSQMCLKPDRTQFEHALLRGALKRNIPILGICGGMQLIAVEMGARLFQHLPSDVPGQIEHKQTAACDVATHRIKLAKHSRLQQIMGLDELQVNSLHHQAVIEGNQRLLVSASADDGVVEAIEVIGHRFCIGVQWHPEYQAHASEHKLFSALAAAANEFRIISGILSGQGSL
ncbi:gamma-glutamyl-gamma-aminobutyrate hydrolase family protein [Undibacterium sp. Ji49W]|uniref:gamma-glutamyl-gamma-aminobutyrate hydrolase family protein n=1 Tax=Undibacterium sp. Ji49W TaxID=3413040 RepID=UPI003BF3E237